MTLIKTLFAFIFTLFLSAAAQAAEPEFVTSGLISLAASSYQYDHPENNTTVYDFDVVTPKSDVFSISGSDSALFSIDATTGVLSFNTPPNYENPLDANGDNSYDINITATNFQSLATTIALRIVITNLNDSAPLITSTPVTIVNEDSLYTYELNATADASNIIVWSSLTPLPSWLSLTQFTLKFGSNGSGDGQFSYPRGVAVDSSGNIYIADTMNNRIQKFNSSGVYLSKFGSLGTGNGQFAYPRSIAIDINGNIYVADSGNNRIQKFNSSGVYLSKFGSYGTGDGQFSNPGCVAFDSIGNIYIADSNNHRIQKFNSSGVYELQFGSNGSGDGQFSFPYSIALDSSGNIYVADYGNHRIQKFNSSGVYELQFGSNGSGDGQFNNPYGIAVDSSGNIYVSDLKNNRIQKFNTSGVYLSQFGSYGTGDGQLNGPHGVVVDSSSNIYVADSGNNHIQKFTHFMMLTGTPSNTDVGVHDINLSVSDGTYSTAHNFQLTVNNVNDAPTNITLSNSTIYANRPSGTLIGTLGVVDEDAGDTHTFSLDCSANGTPFVISGTTLKSAVVFDYNSKSSYPVCVRVRDSGALTFDKNMTIAVTLADSVDHWPSDSRFAADSDNDGLPDEWEIFQYGNLTTANAATDSDADGYTDLQEFNAFLSSNDPMVSETVLEQARRRIAPMLEELSIPSTLEASSSYDINWSVVGYDDGYTTIIALFDCTGIAEGECGGSYGDAFYTQTLSTAQSSENSVWSYGGEIATSFHYGFNLSVPATRANGSAWSSSGTDIVVRFYQKTTLDADAGKSSVSLMVAGGVANSYYDTTGRRLRVRLCPIGGCQ